MEIEESSRKRKKMTQSMYFLIIFVYHKIVVETACAYFNKIKPQMSWHDWNSQTATPLVDDSVWKAEILLLLGIFIFCFWFVRLH